MLNINEYINKDGPKPKQFCKNGHEMVDGNSIQRYAKDGTKCGRRCKACRQNNTLEYKENNPNSQYRLKIEGHMNRRYGIKTLEERDSILASQGGKCAICGTTDCVWDKGFQGVWHIDHKHDGTVNHRGIICSGCNHTIGRANDDPALLRKMADYLESYQTRTEGVSNTAG